MSVARPRDRLTAEAAGPPPAASALPPVLRFSDVLEELEALALLASEASPSGERLTAVGTRARDLMVALRSQFLREVLLGPGDIIPEGSRPAGRPG